MNTRPIKPSRLAAPLAILIATSLAFAVVAVPATADSSGFWVWEQSFYQPQAVSTQETSGSSINVGNYQNGGVSLTATSSFTDASGEGAESASATYNFTRDIIWDAGTSDTPDDYLVISTAASAGGTVGPPGTSAATAKSSADAPQGASSSGSGGSYNNSDTVAPEEVYVSQDYYPVVNTTHAETKATDPDIAPDPGGQQENQSQAEAKGAAAVTFSTGGAILPPGTS